MAEDSKTAPKPADDGLDVIPVNKAPVGVILGVIVAVIVVGGTIAWSMSGTKGKAPDAAPAVAGETLSKEELQQRREHMAMTERALAKAEEAEKAKKAEEEAKKDEEEEAKKDAAPKPASAGPAPVSGAAAKKASGDLDNVLDSTLSGLE